MKSALVGNDALVGRRASGASVLTHSWRSMDEVATAVVLL
jgi:hypothetical protein